MGAQVHFINVHPGDCTVIKHASGHVSMIDICDGNSETVDTVDFTESVSKSNNTLGNFAMCDCNTNPIEYIKSLGIKNLFRFILTHPDMDHMDGFNQLMNEIGSQNFWDSTARRDKPDFNNNGPYLEADWDRYTTVRDGKENGTTVVKPLAGANFKYANKNENDSGGGDGLSILAPNKALLNDADLNDDINEGSYVILYRSIGGNILICGDAHDSTFEYIKKNHLDDVKDVTVLLAPHHGRDSNRSYDFLDFIKPRLTVIGCSPSKYIDYSQWSRRGLQKLTSNQAGNIVLEIEKDRIDVYIENETFARVHVNGEFVRNKQNYVGLWRYDKPTISA